MTMTDPAFAYFIFEPPPNVMYGSSLNVGWRSDELLGGMIQVMLASVGNGCPPVGTAQTVTTLEVAAPTGVFEIATINASPGLYVLEATNGTNQNHILATSHSFHVFPPSRAFSMNQMEAVQPHNTTTLQSTQLCDQLMQMVMPRLNGHLGVITGVVCAVCIPLAFVLCFVLWKSRKPVDSKCPEGGYVTPFVDGPRNQNWRSRICGSLTPIIQKPKSIRTKGSWESISAQSLGPSTIITSPSTVASIITPIVDADSQHRPHLLPMNSSIHTSEPFVSNDPLSTAAGTDGVNVDRGSQPKPHLRWNGTQEAPNMGGSDAFEAPPSYSPESWYTAG